MKLAASRLDVLLILMIVIWGSNYSVIKAALSEIPPIGFNSLRLALAAVLFLVAIGVSRAWDRSRQSRRGGAERVGPRSNPLAARGWIAATGSASWRSPSSGSS